MANSPRSTPEGFAVCLTMRLLTLSSSAWRRLSATRSADSASHAWLYFCLSAVEGAVCRFVTPAVFTLLSIILVAAWSAMFSCAVFVSSNVISSRHHHRVPPLCFLGIPQLRFVLPCQNNPLIVFFIGGLCRKCTCVYYWENFNIC